MGSPTVSPRPAAPLVLICVPWFDGQGQRNNEALVAQTVAMGQALQVGACPVAPFVPAQRTDAATWERYLHALVTRCDAVWVVGMEGSTDNADVAQVVKWAGQHALQVNPWNVSRPST